jgi:hypothetical protein
MGFKTALLKSVYGFAKGRYHAYSGKPRNDLGPVLEKLDTVIALEKRIYRLMQIMSFLVFMFMVWMLLHAYGKL